MSEPDRNRHVFGGRTVDEERSKGSESGSSGDVVGDLRKQRRVALDRGRDLGDLDPVIAVEESKAHALTGVRETMSLRPAGP